MAESQKYFIRCYYNMMEGEELIRYAAKIRISTAVHSSYGQSFLFYTKLLNEEFGKKCKHCGHVQGRPGDGLNICFCSHAEKRIKRKSDAYDRASWKPVANLMRSASVLFSTP